MLNLVATAMRRAQKIRYYHAHGGPQGYDQAMHYYSELSKVARKASRDDLPVILDIKSECDVLMAEMKQKTLK